MQYRKLGNTGLNVSILSFGGSSLGAVFHDINEADAIKAVHVSLDNGINFIDTSPYYGITKAETMLGKALKGIQRDRYFLATKVGQYGEGQFDFSAQRVKKSIDESMARIGVDYIDIIQCHDIEFVDNTQIINETLPALLEMKKAGKVGHVGITGLPHKILHNVLDKTAPGVVETVLSFCHYELNDTSLADHVPYLKSKGVGIINASPTGMGLLTERGCPGWHPASDKMKTVAKAAVDACKTRGINIVELAIQFSIAHPDIATTLVGSASSKNMLDNIAFANKPLDPEKLKFVLDLLKPIANHNFTRGLEQNRDIVTK